MPQPSELELVEETEKVEGTATSSGSAVARINVRAFKMLEICHRIVREKQGSENVGNDALGITTVRETGYNSPKTLS